MKGCLSDLFDPNTPVFVTRRKMAEGGVRELAFKGENIPFLMRDRLRWTTPVLPSADAYAAVGHRDYSRIGL